MSVTAKTSFFIKVLLYLFILSITKIVHNSTTYKNGNQIYIYLFMTWSQYFSVRSRLKLTDRSFTNMHAVADPGI